MSTDQNPLIEFVKEYGPAAGAEGPVRYVKEILGVTPDPWQADVLRDYGGGERRISLRACHGPGKTAVIAWCITHQLTCRFPQKTVATAPTRAQLFDALFAEVMVWMGKLPPQIFGLYNYKSDRIELRSAPDESFFSARTARRESPEALQGIHCDDGFVLLVVDEASGVEEAIFESAVGSMSGHNATTMLASNPTKTSGTFYISQTKLRRHEGEAADARDGTWRCYHIGIHNAPRVTEDFGRQVAAVYGEDSNAYRVRVLGEFPKADEDTVIPFYLVEGAAERDIVVPDDATRIWTVDVARYGADISVLMERTNRSVEWAQGFKNLDTMELVGRIKHEWDNRAATGKQPVEILVDVIGLGAGVVDRLRELGLPVRGINVAESASMGDRYANLRAELWFKAREWLAEKQGRINPELHELRAELVVPKYKYTSSGRIQVESKDDMKKRKHPSPNYADAFVLSFASSAVKATSGRKARRRGQPLKRNLPGIV